MDYSDVLFFSFPTSKGKWGKGESGTSKTYFFTDFWIDEIEKSYEK